MLRRRYTREDYMDAWRACAAIPDWALPTSCRLPGEMDEDFAETLSAVREVGFDDAFMFKFSAREGTPATRMPAELTVPDAVVDARFNELMSTVRGISRDRNFRRVGQRCEVLVEKEARKGELLQARSRDFKTVLIPGDPSLIGQYFHVELTGTTGSTFGQVVRERAAAGGVGRPTRTPTGGSPWHRRTPLGPALFRACPGDEVASPRSFDDAARRQQ
jgi:tRNA-2-methylthio-N6-dimethylallyladenosine synthase